MSQYSADPLSACCGDPGDCNQAHLYCFNRTPKEANVEAMHKFEAAQKQDKIETPEQRQAFDVAFDAKRSAAQAAINNATHGSFNPSVKPGDKVARLRNREEVLTVERVGATCLYLTDGSHSPIEDFALAPNEATIADVRAGLAAVDAQIAKLEAEITLDELADEVAALQATPAAEEIMLPRWALEGLAAAPAKDEIKRPDHYARFAIEPCTFIMLNELPYWAGNVVKYVTRAPHKHADERIDIRKAIRYCEMRIEALDREAAGTDGDVIGRPL